MREPGRECVIWFRKGTRSLSDWDVENMRTYGIAEYEKENPDLPCGLAVVVIFC